MKFWILIGSLLTLLIFPLSNASAEFYRYTDENGVVCFTDDISMVPQCQVESLTTYKETPKPAKPVPAPVSAKAPLQKTGDAPQVEAQKPEPDLDIEAVVGKKMKINQDMRYYSLQYQEARRAKNKGEMDELRKKLLDLSFEMKSLRQEVCDSCGGALPSWWKE